MLNFCFFKNTLLVVLLSIILQSCNSNNAEASIYKTKFNAIAKRGNSGAILELKENKADIINFFTGKSIEIDYDGWVVRLDSCEQILIRTLNELSTLEEFDSSFKLVELHSNHLNLSLSQLREIRNVFQCIRQDCPDKVAVSCSRKVGPLEEKRIAAKKLYREAEDRFMVKYSIKN